MGILAGTMRLMNLTSTKNNIEFRLMNISEKMSALTTQIAENEAFMGDLDPDSPEVKAMNAEKRRLNEYEKKLELQKRKLEIRLQQVTQGIESCQQTISRDIQSFNGAR